MSKRNGQLPNMSLPSDPSQTQFTIADLLSTCGEDLRIVEDYLPYRLRYTTYYLITCGKCEYLVSSYVWGGIQQDTANNGRPHAALGRLLYCYGHITIRGNSAGLAFCASAHPLWVSA